MGTIHILDLQLANLIAAGEVVDRPASAIKEMMENSIDAEATEITVEIKNGGSSFMRVTDNGHGMDEEDAKNCIRRHATSKIKSPSDLDAILTLGFRGEALAAIASVTEFRILTRQKGKELGTLLRCDNGEIVQLCPIGCPEGTTVIAEALFANMPARRKFLKKDLTETGAVVAVVEKIALSHPEISVKLICDERIRFQTAGDGRLAHTIHAVLGKEFAAKLVPVDDETEGIRVWGYLGRPDNVRGNRNYQNFFINGRYIKSTTASAALEQAFTSYCPADRYPCCVLNLDIHPTLVDVNVHPAKLEVKFSNEKIVFHAIYCAVRNALVGRIERPDGAEPMLKATSDDLRGLGDLITYKAESAQAAAEIALSRERLTTPYKQISAFETPNPSLPAQKSTRTVEIDEPSTPAPAPSASKLAEPPCQMISVPLTEEQIDPLTGEKTHPVVGELLTPAEKPACPSGEDWGDPVADRIKQAAERNAIRQDREERPSPPPQADRIPSLSTDFAPDAPSDFGAGFAADLLSLSSTDRIEELMAESEEICAAPTAVPPYTLGGVLFQCYVVVQLSDRLLLIDKHAAHERILFEQLRANLSRTEAMGQLMLIPLPLLLSPAEQSAAEEYREEITAIGFDFGKDGETGDTVLTQIPAELDASAAIDAFTTLVGHLSDGTGTADVSRRTHCERALFQAACKAAVKAGRDDDPGHIRWIVEQVLTRDDIRFCPHGRPVALEMTKSDVEHLFHRP